MSSTKDGFNSLLALKTRPMTLIRFSKTLPTVEVSIRAAPTSYSRLLAGPSSTSISGHEFIISNAVLKLTNFPIPLRVNDRLVDPDLGSLTIEDVDPMYDLGAQIIAWRVRTG